MPHGFPVTHARTLANRLLPRWHSRVVSARASPVVNAISLRFHSLLLCLGRESVSIWVASPFILSMLTLKVAVLSVGLYTNNAMSLQCPYFAFLPSLPCSFFLFFSFVC
ncbi:MAG: hypothetical protein ACI9R3_004039 [Verrucomicrobiales bacterium]|jgi:hypothetical protein